MYRRMHKKGLAEETQKRRTRRTVKHQGGIAGVDLNLLRERQNKSAAAKLAERQAAIAKAKEEKKAKEAKKEKTKVRSSVPILLKLDRSSCSSLFSAGASERTKWAKGIEAADEGWQRWSLSVVASRSPILHVLSLLHVYVYEHPAMHLLGRST